MSGTTRAIVLARKMSGTGTIHDLESDQYDITITMGQRYRYAVGGPAYYKFDWTRHMTEEAALKRYATLKRQGYEGIVILDADGNKAESVMLKHYGY